MANKENTETIDVQTTNCPASSPSCFISNAIGTLLTATGVQYKAIKVGNSNSLNPKK